MRRPDERRLEWLRSAAAPGVAGSCREQRRRAGVRGAGRYQRPGIARALGLDEAVIRSALEKRAFTKRQGQDHGQERVEALADIPHGGRRA